MNFNASTHKNDLQGEVLPKRMRANENPVEKTEEFCYTHKVDYIFKNKYWWYYTKNNQEILLILI